MKKNQHILSVARCSIQSLSLTIPGRAAAPNPMLQREPNETKTPFFSDPLGSVAFGLFWSHLVSFGRIRFAVLVPKQPVLNSGSPPRSHLVRLNTPPDGLPDLCPLDFGLGTLDLQHQIRQASQTTRPFRATLAPV